MRAVSITAKTLVAAVFLTVGCGRAPKHEGNLEGARAEILAIEKQWASAIERQDAAAFERLAAEDFRFIEENGRMLNRAQYIADRSHNPDKVESAVQDEIEVRQYGDAAVATGRSILHGRGTERHSFTVFDGPTCTSEELGDGKWFQPN